MGVRQCHSHQGESIGSLTQTLDAINMGRKAMYGIVISAPVRRKRRYAHCRPCGRDECGTNQDGFHVPKPIAWRNTTSCYGSMKNWGFVGVCGARNPEKELTVAAVYDRPAILQLRHRRRHRPPLQFRKAGLRRTVRNPRCSYASLLRRGRGSALKEADLK